MNHIFKTVWNKALGQIVVVSEHAKSCVGKTTSRKQKTLVSTQNIANTSAKITPLVVGLAVAMTGSTAFALIEDDVKAPNYIETPYIETSNINIGSNGSFYTQLGMGTDVTGTLRGQISTGFISTGEIQGNSLNFSDAKVRNLEITGTLTGLNNIDAGTVTASQNINLTADGVTAFSVNAKRDSEGRVIGADLRATDISSSNIQAGSLNVTNDLSTNNLEVRGALTGLTNIDAGTVTASQNINLTADGVSAFSVNAKRDSEGRVIGADLRVTDISSSNIQTGSLNVTNDLSTNNLEVRGALSVQNLDVQSTNISNLADALEDHQAVNLKQLKENNAEIQANAKTYTDTTATILRTEAAAESERLDKAITDGDAATLTAANKTTADTATAIRNEVKDADTKTLTEAKAYTDTTATTLRTEAAAESERLDKAITDGDAATLTAANKTTADTAAAIRNEVKDADTKTLTEAKAYTDTTATTLRTEAAAESERLDKAITDGDAATLTAANKTTADTAAAIRNEVKDADTKVLNDAKAHTNQTATTTLNTAKQYTDQSAQTVLEQAKAYTDANADGSAFIDIKSSNESEANHAKAEGKDAIAIGAGSLAQGDQSIAIGVGNQVTGNNSGAIGDPNTVSGNASYVVGNNNTVTADNTFVLGNDVDTSAENAVILGNGSTSDRDNTVSVGATGAERQIIHVAAGTADTDAANVKQVKDGDAVNAAAIAKEVTDRQVAVAAEAKARTDADTVLQSNIDAEAATREAADTVNAAAIAKEVTDRQVAVAAEAKARADADTVLQANIDAEAVTREAADTVNAAAIAKEVTDRQVAVASEAKARADADTVLQANIDAEAVTREAADTVNAAAIAKEVTDRQVAVAAEADARIAGDTQTLTDAKAYAETRDQITLDRANAYTDQRVHQLNREFQSFKKESYAAIASSLATASLPQPSRAGRNMLSVAAGTWNNEQGFALGASGITENDKVIYKIAGTGNTQGDFGGSVSFGYQW